MKIIVSSSLSDGMMDDDCLVYVFVRVLCMGLFLPLRRVLSTGSSCSQAHTTVPLVLEIDHNIIIIIGHQKARVQCINQLSGLY